ncbi:MAG: type II toxin-antitoxin system VapC family toxin [Pseudomonadota bacterium]
MILLDTNVLSEPMRPKPSPLVVAWLDAHFGVCALSSITVLELEIGAQSLPAGRRRESLLGAVSLALDRFRPRILPFDDAAARAAATLHVLARSKGLPLSQTPAKLADLQLAGIAAANECSLATRNAADFRGLGLDVIDPWSSTA